jgi:hypothetical protein
MCGLWTNSFPDLISGVRLPAWEGKGRDLGLAAAPLHSFTIQKMM